jgi:DNA-binding CsgD family transcriptional regulator
MIGVLPASRNPKFLGVASTQGKMSVRGARWAPDLVLADLERLALRAPSRDRFFDEAAVRLKRAVPFDGACWHTLDPGSDLITQHRLQDLPDRFPVLADNEYAVDDVNKFEDLARRPRKAATLREATGGHPERSPRFRELLAPAGVGPELRSAFVAEGATWGALILVRREGSPDFDEREVELLDRASALFARAVRRGLVTEASSAAAASDAPGVVELDHAGALTRASSSAESLLAELSGTTARDGPMPPSIHAVASATRQMIDAAGRPRGAPLPSAVVRAPTGNWLVLHGALLGSGSSGEVAVFIQRAHPTLIAPTLLKAYGLTPREREIAQLMLRGATTAQAAQRLAISSHTVTDHISSIFEKTGARTRGELSATLFFGEHLPRIQRDVAIGDDASFVDAPRPRGPDAGVGRISS